MAFGTGTARPKAFWKHFAIGFSLVILGVALYTIWKWWLRIVGLVASLWRILEGQWAIVAVGVLGFLCFVLWKIPKWQVASVGQLPPKDVFELRNEARKTLAQILGGILLAAGLYFTYQTLQVNLHTLQVAQEGQITERFTRAIEQLGNGKLEIRLGGIYALERIARDSARDYAPVMEVLTAYVRENPSWKEGQPAKRGQHLRLAPDIQAVLTVVGRRPRTYGNGENERLNLSRVDIRGANLADAHLEMADLSGSNLGGRTSPTPTCSSRG